MHSLKPALGLWTLVLLLKVAHGDACTSGRYTLSGECCRLCPAGYGVAMECGMENSKCEPCQEGVSFSDSESLSPCLPCSQCPHGVPQTAQCTASQETRCDCGTGFYLRRSTNGTAGLCLACTLCRHGQGAVQACGPQGDTVCRPCGPGTFSEKRTSDNACQPCSQCQDNEVEIRACRPDSDTLCMEKRSPILSRPTDSDGDNNNSAGPTPEQPKFIPQDEGGDRSIPVYVSVLAAIVLGLLLYVAYKCRASCKQKQALGKARSTDPSSAPEGEKLHSDSGVFLDSHSLQENQQNKGSKRDSKSDTRLYLNVAPHRQEEVERLLQEGGDWSWRQLADQLGFEQEQVDTFGRGEDPVHTLLSAWAAQDGSTLGVLCSALTRIDRADVASALCCPTQGTSVV